MMNKLKISLSHALNKQFQGTILINNEKKHTKNQPRSRSV